MFEEDSKCEITKCSWWTKKENFLDAFCTLCGVVSFIIAITSIVQWGDQFPEYGDDLTLCSNVMPSNATGTDPNFCYPNITDLCYAVAAKEVYKYKTDSPAYNALYGLFILDAIGVTMFIYKTGSLACVNKCKCCKCCRKCCNKNCERASLGFDVLAWPVILILTLICVGFASTVKEKDFTKTIEVGWTDYSDNVVDQDLSNCLVKEDCYSYYTLFGVDASSTVIPVNITHSSCSLDKDFYKAVGVPTIYFLIFIQVKGDLHQSITQGLPILVFSTVSLLISLYLFWLLRKQHKEGKNHNVETPMQTQHQSTPAPVVMTGAPAPPPQGQYPPQSQYPPPQQYPVQTSGFYNVPPQGQPQYAPFPYTTQPYVPPPGYSSGHQSTY